MMSKKKWLKFIAHIFACELNEKIYLLRRD